MVRFAPVVRLRPDLELHGLDVRPGDDDVAFNDPHGECGHSPTLPHDRAKAEVWGKDRNNWNSPSFAIEGGEIGMMTLTCPRLLLKLNNSAPERMPVLSRLRTAPPRVRKLTGSRSPRTG